MPRSREYVWIEHPKRGVLVAPGSYGAHERRFADAFWLDCRELDYRERLYTSGSNWDKAFRGYCWKSWRGFITISQLHRDLHSERCQGGWAIPDHIRTALARKLKGRISPRMSPYEHDTELDRY